MPVGPQRENTLCAIGVSQMKVAPSNQGTSVLNWCLMGRSDGCNSRSRYPHFFMSPFFRLLQKFLLILLLLPHHLCVICLNIQQKSGIGGEETQTLSEIIKMIDTPAGTEGGPLVALDQRK